MIGAERARPRVRPAPDVRSTVLAWAAPRPSDWSAAEGGGSSPGKTDPTAPRGGYGAIFNVNWTIIFVLSGIMPRDDFQKIEM